MKSILGIGNALVDILAQLPNDDLLTAFNLPKGSMQHVDETTSNKIWETLRNNSSVKHVAGGSAANTLAGTAQLGLRSAYIGKTGNDEIGNLFAEDQSKQNVRHTLLKSATATGRCMVFISPDTERTMATYLGAAIELVPEDLTAEMFEGYDYFHIEGYLVQNHALVQRAVELAKAKGLIISLDLASYNVVEANKTFLLDIVKNYVDIVFANETEAEVFTGKQPHEALIELNKLSHIAIVKIGCNGSLVKCGEQIHTIDVFPANAIDATGAGDLYAAGFIYAHSLGLPLDKCGKAASLVAAKVVEVVGSHLDKELWATLRNTIATY